MFQLVVLQPSPFHQFCLDFQADEAGRTIRFEIPDVSWFALKVTQANGKQMVISTLHPGRLTWNLQITNLERKMIFQTPMIMFHVNLLGCKGFLKG